MSNIKTASIEPATLYQPLLLFFLALAIYLTLITGAFATNTPMGAVLCNIADMIYGNLGRGLATLAIIIVGVGATLGKVSWGLAITVAIGISIIGNAPTLVTLMGMGIGC